MIDVAKIALPNKDENQITMHLIASPSYKIILKGKSMYELDQIRNNDKSAANVLKEISEADKKLHAANPQRQEGERLFIPEKMNDRTL